MKQQISAVTPSRRDPDSLRNAILAFGHLADALSAAGRLEESRRGIEDWCASLQRSQKGSASKEGINRVRCYVLYSMGDFAGLERETQVDSIEEGQSARLQALIEQGKLEEATTLLGRTALGDDAPAYLLAISIAAAAKGDNALAADYRQQARLAIENEKGRGSSAAALLARTTPPTRRTSPRSVRIWRPNGCWFPGRCQLPARELPTRG